MILYLHGFRSSPKSFKARVVGVRMLELGLADKLLCPQLPASPKAAIELAVAVVGGGLGGLASACVLAARGHRVTLYDKNPWIGGKASDRLTPTWTPPRGTWLSAVAIASRTTSESEMRSTCRRIGRTKSSTSSTMAFAIFASLMMSRRIDCASSDLAC